MTKPFVFTLIKFFSTFFIAFLPLVSYSQVSERLVDVFPSDVVSTTDTQGYSSDSYYNQSSSYWALQFQESSVFQFLLKHENLLEPNDAIELRVGKGGQIYSMIGSFGESIGPQYRGTADPSYGGGTSFAPWMDEVWQQVLVDNSINNNADSIYHVHQAGIYLTVPDATEPYFGPIVASYYDSIEHAYTTVNWGQLSHADVNVNTHFKSHTLHYNRYKLVGDGILQVDYLTFNFGPSSYDYLVIPHGGVRKSNLNEFFVSNTSGGQTNLSGIYGVNPVVAAANTAGWVAWSNQSSGNSPTMAMTFSTVTECNNQSFRYGDAGSILANARDLHVYQQIHNCNTESISKGKGIRIRYYLVVGTNLTEVKNKIAQYNLNGTSENVLYNRLSNQTDSSYFQFDKVNGQIEIEENVSDGLKLYAQPFLSAVPLFLLTDSLNQDYLTSNPYELSDFPWDGVLKEMKLLGYRTRETKASVYSDTICEGSWFNFPDGTSAILDKDTLHITSYSLADYDSLVLTHVHVKQVQEEFVISGGQCIAIETNADAYQWMDCNQNFQALVGATSSTFSPTQNGDYALEVSMNNCKDTSFCQRIENLGIPNLEQANYSVVPNPSTGKFQLTGIPEGTYNLLNAKGQLVQRVDLKMENSFTIDLNRQPKGSYFLQVGSKPIQLVVH